jgi:hypothetical protein
MSEGVDEESVYSRVRAYLEANPEATNEDVVLDYWQNYQPTEFLENKRELLTKIETILRSKRKFLKPSEKTLEQKVADSRGWDLFEQAEADKTVKNNVHIDSCDCR